tara:strand:+ start:145 stop:2022 length:1878 start_codon:yes stop_codon:yes gene_type:complete
MSKPREAFNSCRKKPVYRKKIEMANQASFLNRAYEFLDDYSYGESRFMGIYIYEDEEKYLDDDDNVKKRNVTKVAFFMEKGPSMEQMEYILEWNSSARNNPEDGHEGDGNTFFLYGGLAFKVELWSKINKDSLSYGAINPESIYKYVCNEEITEAVFSNNIDTQTYITRPNKRIISTCLKGYHKLYSDIKNGIKKNINDCDIGYIIEFSFSDKHTFIKEDKWKTFCCGIAAKQYDIPIYVQNSIIGETEFKKIINIDLLGLTDKTKQTKTRITELYYDGHSWYIKHNNDYYNIENKKKTLHTEHFELWGNVEDFIIDLEYFKSQLKMFGRSDLKGDTFYGAYITLNEKQVNYLPLNNHKLPDSKNNRMDDTYGCNRYRIILKPKKGIEPNLLKKLVVVRGIKAETKFLDTSPHATLCKLLMDIQKGVFPKKQKKQIKKIKPLHKKKTSDSPVSPDGFVYILYLASGVWKLGMTFTEKAFKERLNKHKNESIKTVKKFSKKDIETKTATVYFKQNTSSPKGYEEKMMKLLKKFSEQDEYKEKIQLYVANNGEPSREYFTCSDHDFITQTFIPEIKKQFKNTIENSNDNSNMISNPPPLPDTREHLNSINSKDKDKPKHEPMNINNP